MNKYRLSLVLGEEEGRKIHRLVNDSGRSPEEIVEGIVKLYFLKEAQDPGLTKLGQQVIDLVQAYKAGKRAPAGQIISPEIFRDLRRQGHSYTSIGARYGLHRSTVQRALSRPVQPH